MRSPLILLAAGSVAALAPATAAAAPSYTDCPAVGSASAVSVFSVGCPDVAAVAGAVAATTPANEAAVLSSAGWQPLRAQQLEGDQHDIVAIRGHQALRLRRSGAAPDLDGFMGNRQLLFSRRTIVGGKPVPRDGAICTSSWTVRLRDGSFGGLTASHCAGLRKDGTAQRRNSAVRRPPQPGFVLGRVRRQVDRDTALDALVLPVPVSPTRTLLPVIDRGTTRPPLFVVGGATAKRGLSICLSGVTSGIDNCGNVARSSAARNFERRLKRRGRLQVRCTNFRTRQGDSGGPVYTKPGADGTVRAVGLTDILVGPTARMCFTPLKPVLAKLRARLVTG